MQIVNFYLLSLPTLIYSLETKRPQHPELNMVLTHSDKFDIPCGKGVPINMTCLYIPPYSTSRQLIGIKREDE